MKLLYAFIPIKLIEIKQFLMEINIEADNYISVKIYSFKHFVNPFDLKDSLKITVTKEWFIHNIYLSSRRSKYGSFQ